MTDSHRTGALMDKSDAPPEVFIEEEHQEEYGYDVEDTPPLFVIVTSAFQYLFLCMGTVITTMTVLSETVCADINDPVRSVLFSSSVFLTGIATAVQSFLGLRLPVFQGASASYLVPLLLLKGTETWACPKQDTGNVTVNATLSAADITTPETVYRRLAELQGSLIAASVFEVLIGLTGLLGILMKLISPIVIGVTIFCLGYSFYPVTILLCGAHWGIALCGAVLLVLMAIYLSHIRVPLPQCNRKSNQLRSTFPIFQVFPVLLTLILVWITCAVCTKFNIFSDDPKDPSYKARTDVRMGIIRNTPWILIPYPGQFGLPGFNTAVFIGFLIAVITSIIESVGDYISLSRVCKAYPVPKHAMNRGIAIEGIISVISGCFGTGHATTSYSTINSLLGITKIRSRLVMVVAGILAIVLAIFGKFGAVMTSVPAPALGSVSIIMVGFMCALGLSSLQSIEMRSSRNISVIGISIYVAIVMAEWQRQFPDSLRTEYEQLNQAIKVTIGNAMFTGFALSLILDNTVRGYLTELVIPYNPTRALRSESANLITVLSGLGPTMKLLVCLMCVGVALSKSLSPDLDGEWELFKQKYNKNYPTEEHMLRRLIWEDNVNYVQHHNLAADRGEHTFWVGINEYADMATDEFVNMMNGYRMNPNRTAGATYLPPSNIGDLPDTVDWRDKGYVTPIKNQERCGSCWSFSSTGSLEGQHFKKTGKLVSLSEQNLVDCSQAEGNHGCMGGLMDNAFRYIEKNNGIDTEESYPYTAKNGKCHFKRENVGATDVGYTDIKRESEDDLQSAVATVGPISVAIDAGHKSFQLYKSGVYSEPMCSSVKLDHGVLAVGYGSHEGQDYWLVKNSWGTVWGMEGYIMMARNKNNMCGIATVASYPRV